MAFDVDLPDDPTIEALDAEARAVVAGLWTDRTRSERRASAIFAVIAGDLLAQGAIPEVLDRATRAVHDEARHVEICRQVASRYAGEAVPWPPAEPSPIPMFTDASPELARELYVVANTCVAESVGVAYLSACRSDAEGPLVRAAIQLLLRDDVDHARIGWAHLASDRPSAALRGALPRALPALLRAVRRAYFDRAAEIPESPPRGHGCPSPAAIREAVDLALVHVVVPGFEHVGVDTRAARRWLDSIVAGSAAAT
ncbi:MAG: hypothetical protein R3B09_22320 [Nannocystaceae bacterium]